ncbi:MAG: UDP-N-acetylmuramate dehydrogenase [Blastocatellia bacterium]|nr:UDP-N-acetylmuramate dehydrogenase [Blastocatellia bacterium]
MQSLEIRENVPLAPLTTLGVGGPARYFVEAVDLTQLTAALREAQKRDIPAFILGGGSNLVVADAGFDGMVVKIALGVDKFEVAEAENNGVRVTVGSGMDWDVFVARCVEADLAGVECLSGIPGTVGGTPIQNVGAYGQDVSESIVAVACLDRESRTSVTFTNTGCQFAYRSNIFNREMRDRYVVLSVTFELLRGGQPKIVYKDLIERFEGSSPTVEQVRDAVLRIRAAKSMVIDQSDPNSRSAGSFFKNPIVPLSKLVALRKKFTDLVSFPAGESAKLSAAWLIENAGFYKGYSKGTAGISSRHSLAIVNLGGATAADVVDLHMDIMDAVNARFGVALIPEPLFVGFESSGIISV